MPPSTISSSRRCTARDMRRINSHFRRPSQQAVYRRERTRRERFKKAAAFVEPDPPHRLANRSPLLLYRSKGPQLRIGIQRHLSRPRRQPLSRHDRRNRRLPAILSTTSSVKPSQPLSCNSVAPGTSSINCQQVLPATTLGSPFPEITASYIRKSRKSRHHQVKQFRPVCDRKRKIAEKMPIPPDRGQNCRLPGVLKAQRSAHAATSNTPTAPVAAKVPQLFPFFSLKKRNQQRRHNINTSINQNAQIL